MIGELLNQRYKIQSILGQRVGRKTFLALDRQDRCLVVVKLLLFNPDFESLDDRPIAGTIAPVKPHGSRVKIGYSTQAIEILIPARGFRIEFLFLALFAVAWNTFITFWTGATIFMLFPINLIFAIFSLPFWGVGLSMMGGLLFGIWGRTRIKIDGDRIQKTLELFNFRWQHPKPMPREEITRLIRQNQSYKKDSDGDRVTVPSCLVLQAGTETYKLSDLSEPSWIGLEPNSANGWE